MYQNLLDIVQTQILGMHPETFWLNRHEEDLENWLA